MLYVFSSFLASTREYVCDGIKQEAEILYNVLDYPYHSKIKQWARRFLIGRIPLPVNLLLSLLEYGEREKSCLKNIRSQDKVVVWDVYNPRVFKALLGLLPHGCRVYVYLSNPVDRCFHSPEKILDKLRKMGAICCSFDPRDAEKYNMRMAGQYFFSPIKENVCVGETNYRQAFFCGQAKDRAEEISAIKSFLQNHRIQCDFHVPMQGSPYLNFKQEYLLRLSQTGIVVDINQKGQSGLTRRPIEALLWGKKLVTNNQDIVNYDFYRPENVFIYGVDDPRGFEHFVETPLTEIPENIKSRYTAEGWLKQFS